MCEFEFVGLSRCCCCCLRCDGVGAAAAAAVSAMLLHMMILMTLFGCRTTIHDIPCTVCITDDIRVDLTK